MAAQKAQRRMKSDEMAPGEARPGPRAVQLPVRGPEPSPATEAEARARPAGETVAPAQQAAASAPKGMRKTIFSLVGAAALVAAGWYGYHYMTVGRFIVSTDDAYVGAYMSMVSPKVSANVVAVPIVDNQAIKAGDVLIQLDQGDYKLAVDQAAAKVATQHSMIETFDAQIKSAEAAAVQARAQLNSVKATLERAEADFKRTDTLAQRDYSPRSTLDAARAARDTAKAQVAAQNAAIQSADAKLRVLRAQKVQAERSLKESKWRRRRRSVTSRSPPFARRSMVSSATGACRSATT